MPDVTPEEPVAAPDLIERTALLEAVRARWPMAETFRRAEILALIDAAPAAVPHARRATGELDAAWAAAEAALPEGWAITLLWGTVTEDRWAVSASPWPTKPGDPSVVTGAPTPAEALLALAARLQESSGVRHAAEEEE